MKNAKQDIQGAALVELALIVGLLLFLLLGGLDLNRMLRRSHVLDSLSKQGGNRVFRECVVLNTSIQECLDQIHIEFTTGYVQAALPGAQLVISVFDLETNTTFRAPVGATSAYALSESSVQSLAATSSLLEFNDAQRLVIAEASYQVSDSRSIAGLTLGPKRLYEVTIY